MFSEWQPIETAPKDGGKIMVFALGWWLRPATASWQPSESRQAGGWWDVDGMSEFAQYHLTHWMPLPEPPNV